MAAHSAGDPLECYGIPIVLQKTLQLDELGRQAFDADGKQIFVSGFRIGGGIDQDPAMSPQGYPDTGIYVTYIYEGGAADRAGLLVHDKLLQVNGQDFTIVTHKKAVEYIGRKPVLNMLVSRKGLPQLQQQRFQQPSSRPVQLYQQSLYQQQCAPTASQYRRQ